MMEWNLILMLNLMDEDRNMEAPNVVVVNNS